MDKETSYEDVPQLATGDIDSIPMRQHENSVDRAIDKARGS